MIPHNTAKNTPPSKSYNKIVPSPRRRQCRVRVAAGRGREHILADYPTLTAEGPLDYNVCFEVRFCSGVHDGSRRFCCYNANLRQKRWVVPTLDAIEVNMDWIAVDVVLLPDEAMTQLAIDANSRLLKKYGRQIVLSMTDCLPHISLAMGCMERGQIEPVRGLLQRTAADCPPGELVVTGIVTTLNAEGRQVSSFVLAKTPAIQSLHERIMEAMQPYFSYDAKAEMIYGNEPVAATTLAWIRTFREKSSFGAFFPHITIGCGWIDRPMTFPIRTTASRLALCHLGNHCTCRKVLADADL